MNSTGRTQAQRQGKGSGIVDQGARRAVTGGAHLDGFVGPVRKLLLVAGLPGAAVHTDKRLQLPGLCRHEKKWDVVVVLGGRLLASMEFKAHVGPSFGNNCDNRAEETVGSAAGCWTAYRDGAFADAPRPWLGYVMLLEDADGSRRPVSVREPHFPVGRQEAARRPSRG